MEVWSAVVRFNEHLEKLWWEQVGLVQACSEEGWTYCTFPISPRRSFAGPTDRNDSRRHSADPQGVRLAAAEKLYTWLVRSPRNARAP